MKYTILRYWRNCLADAARANINSQRLREAFRIDRTTVLRGRIDSSHTKKIFKLYEDTLKKQQRKDCHNGIHQDENYEIPTVPLLISPVVAVPRTTHAATVAGRDNPITPIWTPAILSRNGDIHPASEEQPWIPRNLLEPIERAGETIGDIETVDKFLSIKPCATNEEDKELHPRWVDVWQYCDEMLQYVAQQSINTFTLEGHETIPHSYLLLDQEDDKRIPARHIIRLYDIILRDLEAKFLPAIPNLLERYISLTSNKLTTLLTPKEEIEKSSEHYGQMSWQFPLSQSQRETMHHVLVMKDGEILAINGPPGTGKTTLLQSIVATLWTKRAIQKGDPPIIVATSTNNQAVTNVIDSFGKVSEHESPLAGRWIPKLKSYGLYCPASTKQKPSNKYQTTKTQGGFYLALTQEEVAEDIEHLDIETERYVASAEEYFLKCCSNYARQNIANVKEAENFLHRSLLECVYNIEQGPKLWLKMQQQADIISSAYGAAGGIDKYIQDIETQLDKAKKALDKLETDKQGWLEYAEKTPFWVALLSGFISVIKQRLVIRNKLYFSSVGMVIDADLGNHEDIINFFKQEETTLKRRMDNILIKLGYGERDKVNFEEAQNEWYEWSSEYNTLYFEPPKLLELMDTTLRYKAFKLATHYWEARWLLEMKEQIETNYEEKQTKNKQERRWHRYAKLTPCVVTTLHMLPSFFSAYNWQATTHERNLPLYDFIDLLIVDEAGQVSPDIAGATFSLAKKALAVGDILQIEPVWGINKHIDIANMKKYQVIETNCTVDIMFDTGLSSSGGNVMKIAQRASKYQKTDIHGSFERGMFLSEHRRCVPEIIDYCNRLAYKGRLIPARESKPDYPLPHLGYAHIQGKSVKMGSSRGNPIEARVIAHWVSDHKGLLRSLYPNLPLQEIIAIVTPFKKQTNLLRKELLLQGINERIEIGTIHVLQGAERHVVLFSPVYGTNDNDTTYFFDRGVNMLNVAVSRAKDSFLVFGNMNIFNSNNTTVPSGLLGQFLFVNESNEITDIKMPLREDIILSESVLHLDTLEAHRKALAESIFTARKGVWIVSPFITETAVVADGIPALIREATDRGVTVTVYTDPKFNIYRDGRTKESFLEAVKRLVSSGAVVKYVRSDHSKTLIVDTESLTEGSFNWLSASRDSASKYHRRERSLRYSGKNVGSIITKIIKETEGRVEKPRLD